MYYEMCDLYWGGIKAYTKMSLIVHNKKFKKMIYVAGLVVFFCLHDVKIIKTTEDEMNTFL